MKAIGYLDMYDKKPGFCDLSVLKGLVEWNTKIKGLMSSTNMKPNAKYED